MKYYMKIESIEFSNLIWRLTRWPRRMILPGKWSVNIQKISVVLSSFQKTTVEELQAEISTLAREEDAGSKIFL